MLYELMIKADYLLPLSKWSQIERGRVYSIDNGELIIALDEISQPITEKMIVAKLKKVITLIFCWQETTS